MKRERPCRRHAKGQKNATLLNMLKSCFQERLNNPEILRNPQRLSKIVKCLSYWVYFIKEKQKKHFGEMNFSQKNAV